LTKMAPPKTRVSTKGQVILPKAVRDKRNWPAGTELNIEETPEGVLLTAARPLGPTKFEDVFGCLGPVDRTISDKDMHEAVLAEARRRYARD
jgi:AbrB family looped-hinge helix DNA binding protein